MTTKQMSSLPEKAIFSGNEKIYINDGGVSKQIAANKLTTDLTVLPEKTAELDGTEKVYINDNGESKQIAVNKLDKKDYLCVNFTENSGNFTADKTFIQILEALDDGKFVYGKINTSLIPFTSGDDGPLVFQTQFYDINEDDAILSMTLVRLIIQSDNTVDLQEATGNFVTP